MSKITPDTRFRKSNFTLYERLDTFYEYINNLFNTNSCPFQILQFQFEKNHNSSESERQHAQRFAKLRIGKQLRVGDYDSRTKKGSEIKLIFEANVHLDFANGTDEECLAYTSKNYDRCKLPEHNPNPKKGLKCKCDFKDITKICKYCNENCKRTFARVNKDPKISGLFLFTFEESMFDTDNNKEENQNFYKEAINEVLNRENVDDVYIKYASKYKR